MAGHNEITGEQKVTKIKRIMKRTGLDKKDASMFLKLMLTNERFTTFKGKALAFKVAKNKGITIEDAMKMIMKRRKNRQQNNAMDNLTGGMGDASSTIGDLESLSLEEEFDDFEGQDFVKKNSKMLIVVGIGLFLLFTPMGKGLIKKITG
jgi:hypothetical protein